MPASLKDGAAHEARIVQHQVAHLRVAERVDVQAKFADAGTARREERAGVASANQAIEFGGVERVPKEFPLLVGDAALVEPSPGSGAGASAAFAEKGGCRHRHRHQLSTGLALDGVNVRAGRETAAAVDGLACGCRYCVRVFGGDWVGVVEFIDLFE